MLQGTTIPHRGPYGLTASVLPVATGLPLRLLLQSAFPASDRGVQRNLNYIPGYWKQGLEVR